MSLLPLYILCLSLLTSPRQGPLQLKSGDVVAMVGSAYIEREQRDGYLELGLTLAFPEADVTYRNLGWSGDNVSARARRFFGSNADGMQHLLDHVELVQPTHLLLCYGKNEAFAGETGRADFLSGYKELLDKLDQSDSRLTLLVPPPMDERNTPAPDVARAVNAELREQARLLQELAKERGYGFIDVSASISAAMQQAENPRRLTDNGLHLTSEGYRATAEWIIQDLLGGASQLESATTRARPVSSQAVEQLRQAILEKNKVFFHRHRPQNETYLRGFRKHEQGNNAGEILKFEPLTRAQDKTIFELRRRCFSKD